MLSLDVLLSLVIVFILAFMVAEFSYWLHWTMGSPTAKNDYTTEIDNAQIFSFFGRWVLKKYIQRNIINRSKAVREAMPIIQNEIDRGLLQENERAIRLNKIANEIHYLNPYKALGVCIYCFAAHLGNFMQLAFWIAFYTLLDIKLSIFYPVFIFIFFWSIILFFLHKKLTSENE